MGFQDVAFLPYRAHFSTTCLETVVGASKGMYAVKYFRSNKAFICVSQILWRSKDCYKDEVNPASLSVWGYCWI